MERTRLVELADRALEALYDSGPGEEIDPAFLIDELGIDETELARVVRYVAKQGWVESQGKTLGRALPHRVSFTPDGLRYIETRKRLRQPPSPPIPHVVHNTFSGPNARQNIGSHDESRNIVNIGGDALFGEIQQSVQERVADPELRGAILAAVQALRQAPDQPTRVQRLAKLLEVSANAMTVMGPHLQPLTQWVLQAGS